MTGRRYAAEDKLVAIASNCRLAECTKRQAVVKKLTKSSVLTGWSLELNRKMVWNITNSVIEKSVREKCERKYEIDR